MFERYAKFRSISLDMNNGEYKSELQNTFSSFDVTFISKIDFSSNKSFQNTSRKKTIKNLVQKHLK